MKKTVKFITLVAGLATLLLVVFGVFAQDDEMAFGAEENMPLQVQSFSMVSAEPVETNETKIEPFSCGTGNCAYLPLTGRSPELVLPLVLSKTSCSASFTETLMDSDTITLGSGIRSLAFAILANGYAGSSYEVRFVINGSEITALRETGTITSNSQSILSAAVIFTSTGFCQSVLPGGTFQAQFYIDNELKRVLQANLP